MATHGGAADSYYSGGQPQAQINQDNGYQGANQPKYERDIPNYGQSFQHNNGTPQVDGKQTFAQAFKLDKPKYNDIWAGILLILTFLGFAAVSGLSLQGYSANKAFSGGGIYHAPNEFSLNTNTIVLFAFVLALAFTASWLYFTMARAFTKQFIWITGILNIVFGIGTAIYYFTKHYYSAAIVFAVFSIFSIICFISWIPRIPFSVVMLQQTMDIAKGFGHVFLASALGGIAALAFGAWFSVTLVAVYVKYESNSSGSTNGGGRTTGAGRTNPACSSSRSSSCSSAKVVGLVVFITFAGYWITEWIKNTLHSTIAGVYGSWFFCSGKPGGMPKGPTRGAFRRAITYSFGSISFGSLVVALINMLRQAVSIARQQEAQSGNVVASIAFCLLGCFIGILEWAVTFINRYAFSHIALYGKAYIPAAKDTWKIMKDRGIDALVNDCLISPVLTMGSTFVAYLCSLLAFLYLQFTDPAYNSGGTFTPVIMAFAFLIGLQVCQIFLTPIGSGVDTIFVAAAWDPDVLMRDHPDFYARMVSTYPKVQQMIHA
ncbi:putative choline transporter, neither null mutation nor overexpression affects choline transport [Sticta canariensis]|nr:putative choline transporter, neither null mutation nor overexpression affects choline transport [Sticta canariensis]